MEKPALLICDDDDAVREAYKLILAKDFDITFVMNGKEAFEHLKKKVPALTLMDIKMPQMNGLEALKAIRRARPHAKILMVTGYEATDVAIQAVKLGASDYITKPFQREALRSKVDALLNLK